MPVFVYLIFLHVFAAIAGLHSVAGDANLVGYLLQLTFAILVVLTCAKDASARGRPIVSIVQLLMLLFWPIAGPVYLVYSRGWRGILWCLLWMLTLFASFFLPAACEVMLLWSR